MWATDWVVPAATAGPVTAPSDATPGLAGSGGVQVPPALMLRLYLIWNWTAAAAAVGVNHWSRLRPSEGPWGDCESETTLKASTPAVPVSSSRMLPTPRLFSSVPFTGALRST